MELTKTKFKQTEVGLIPEDWEVKSIKDISSPVRGGSPRPAGSPMYFNGNFIPWLTVASLTNIPDTKRFVDFTQTYLTEAGSKLSRTLEKGTLIIANSGATLGVAKLLSIKCCANDGVAALLNIYKNCDSSYLVYFINSITKKLREDIATGNGQPNLNTELIGNLQIPLPPLQEQKAIAQVLSDTDNLIQAIEKKLTKKRAIKQGAMQQLLTPKEDWEVKKLGDIAKYRRGSFPQPYGLPQWYDENNGTPFVQVFDVDKNMRLKSTTKQKISDLAKDKSVFVRKGNVVITLQGSIGRIAITQYDAYVDRTLLIFTDYKVPIDKVFFAFVIQEKFRIEKENAPGGIIKTITKEELSKFDIPLPKTIDEQTEIATILSDMDAEISQLEQKLSKYKMVKQGIMQNLLTGKIRLV